MHRTFFLFSPSPFLLCRDHELTPAEKGILLHAQVYWYKTASNPLSFMLFGHFSLQKNCDFEIRENEAEQERLQGTAIVYGEKVQVRVTRIYLGLPHKCKGCNLHSDCFMCRFDIKPSDSCELPSPPGSCAHWSHA